MNAINQNFTVKLFFSTTHSEANRFKGVVEIYSCRDIRLVQMQGATLVECHCINGTDEDKTVAVLRDSRTASDILSGKIDQLQRIDYALAYYTDKGYILNKVVVENMKGVNTQVISPTSVLEM